MEYRLIEEVFSFSLTGGIDFAGVLACRLTTGPGGLCKSCPVVKLFKVVRAPCTWFNSVRIS